MQNPAGASARVFCLAVIGVRWMRRNASSAKRCWSRGPSARVPALRSSVARGNASGTRELIDVHLQVFLFDDLGELLRLGVDEVSKLLRRAVVGAGAHIRDVLFDLFTLQ